MNMISQPQPIPRPAPRMRPIYGPSAGSMSVVRRRAVGTGNGDLIVEVGEIHIHQRNTHDPFRVCKICGHPYDHNGTPHSAYLAERRIARRGETRRGETLTGPDGNIYWWNGALWELK